MADLGFDGKVAIVTGAAGGLGRSHAMLLASRGAQVVVTTNPGCILQIRAGLKKARADIEVLHIADFLMRDWNNPNVA